MFKYFLFDFDGTLLDSDQMIVVTFEDLYKLFRPNDSYDPKSFLRFSGPPIKESLLEEFPNVDQDLAFKEFVRISEINYVKYVKPFPYVKECLLDLKSKGNKIALITSKGREATDFALKLVKLDNLFDFVICADEVKKVKPDPEGILLALKSLNVLNKDEAIYIGDSMYDYLTAKNASVKFAYVSFSPRKLFKGCKANYIVNSYKTFLEDLSHEKN